MPRPYSADLRERALVACERREGSRAEVEGALAERGDATLAELADGLAARTGRRWSPSALCRALKRLGWPRKKRRSGPPSRTAPTSPRRGMPGARRSPPA